MAEIRQTNFRLDQETVEKFRKFCDETGMNQADGFSYLMNLIDVNNTMAAAPSRKTEIENFQKHLKDMTMIYLNSVDLCTDAEARIRDEYRALVESKDITISDLQAKVKNLENGYDEAKAASDQAVRDAAQAAKDAAVAQKQADTADQLCREKEETIAGLKEKLAGYEALKMENEAARERLSEMEALRSENEELSRTVAANKAEADRKAADAEQKHADALKAEREASKRALADAEKDHENVVGALRIEMAHKISDAEKDAALAVANAVSEKEREMTARLLEIEKENATLQARIKLLEERIKELQEAAGKR